MTSYSPPARSILRTLLLFFFLINSYKGFNQTLPPKVTNFGQETYLGSPQVFSTDLLPDGRRVFGTIAKVVIHDGTGFTDVEISPGSYVASLDVDRYGRIFIGTNTTFGVIEPDSLGEYEFKSFSQFLPDSIENTGIVWQTYCTPDQKIYFRTSNALYVYEKGEIHVHEPRKAFYRMHTHISKHPILEDFKNGLLQVNGAKSKYLPNTAAFLGTMNVSTLLPLTPSPYMEEKDTSWLLFTKDNGAFQYYPNQDTLFPYPSSEKKLKAEKFRVQSSTLLSPEKNPYGAAFALGTENNGILFLKPDGSIATKIDRPEGLPAKLIWEVNADEQGNIWAATNNGISLLHTGTPFTVLKEGKQFQGAVTDIEELPAGNTNSLFLSTSQGVWHWNKQEQAFIHVKGTSMQTIDLHSIKEKGMHPFLAVAGAHHAYFLFPSNSPDEWLVAPFTKKQPNCLEYLSPNQNPQKGVLMGGRQGINLHEFTQRKGRMKWEKQFSITKLPQEVESLQFDSSLSNQDSMVIWAGMRTKGILKIKIANSFEGFDLTRYDTAHGLPKGSIEVFPHPKDPGVIFGSSKGLLRFENGTFKPYCDLGKAFCNGSQSIIEVKKGAIGDIWIQDRTLGQLKHLLPENEQYRIDSLPFLELDLGAIIAIKPGKKKTWIGGDKGLACYHAQVIKNYDRRWPCLIRKVHGSRDSLLFAGNFSKFHPSTKSQKSTSKGTTNSRILVEDQPESMVPVLAYSHNRMEFQFAAPHPDYQEEVKYSYKLAGFDTVWNQWTKETKKEYTNLPEGKYTFQVKAKNIYGKESDLGTYQFTILPPWYRTWTAYTGYSLTTILFIWFLLWINSRRLIAQKQRLEATVEERTNQIRKEKNEVERQKARVEEAHQDITDSINYAKRIQNALLQAEDHISSHLPDHFVFFQPQATVSGDFYWAAEKDGYLYLAVIDCTGHGVPGAFMSMLGVSFLNDIMASKELQTPGAILTRLKERVVKELSGSGTEEEETKDGMDVAMVRVPLSEKETPAKRIQFAGANNPIYIIPPTEQEGADPSRPYLLHDPSSETLNLKMYQGGTPIGLMEERIKPIYPSKGNKSSEPPKGLEVKGDKRAVGYDPDAPPSFTTTELDLDTGSMVYLFSDGFADQFGGPKGKKFRYRPFKKLLIEVSTQSTADQKNHLARTFEEWKGDQEQIDDVCVLGFHL